MVSSGVSEPFLPRLSASQSMFSSRVSVPRQHSGIHVPGWWHHPQTTVRRRSAQCRLRRQGKLCSDWRRSRRCRRGRRLDRVHPGCSGPSCNRRRRRRKKCSLPSGRTSDKAPLLPEMHRRDFPSNRKLVRHFYRSLAQVQSIVAPLNRRFSISHRMSEINYWNASPTKNGVENPKRLRNHPSRNVRELPTPQRSLWHLVQVASWEKAKY